MMALEREPTHEEDPLVRPYILTVGRDRSGCPALDVASLVVTTDATVDEDTVEPEQLRMLSLCRVPQSVADVSASLDMPLAVVKVLLGDLITRGYLRAHAPAQSAAQPELLSEVLAGLRRL
ncbi:DUF742 domain-containing protein [Spiractinospora alimapuensis]|uniref:DUF742 domain-containing protein n=1 Tax=Spiractinospora alimapuensis TaxID=2820884 RepID=UPI001F47FE3D|nr:DUF742 domain-containing protein [Spiractinospora alimapuensis]QVQ54290.1 DUF742 domain-containing protein [Spiractinospora alimapuensis]